MNGYRVVLSWLVVCGWSAAPHDSTSLPAAENAGEAVVGETMTRAEWKREIRGWLERLRASHRTGDNLADDLKERIRNIRDPNALDALKVALADGSDYPRIVFLEPLALIGGREAFRTLVDVSVTDGNVLVRKAAAEWLQKTGDAKDAIPQYVRYLRAPRYCASAAGAVSASGLTRPLYSHEKPDAALTNALINALVRIEVQRVVTGGRGFGMSMGSSGGGSFHAFKQRVERYYISIQNPVALKTLVGYTGQDFGYDQAAWRRWYRSAKNRNLNVN
ncbi:MAG: HEAT repeat domain-containing protein [Planctomycetota bacterium]|jgi:hypothetical protein